MSQKFKMNPFSLYNIKISMKNPATILGLVLVAFFIYTILVPVLGLLISSVQVGVRESFRMGGEVGDFTT